MERELCLTKDGSYTFYVPALHECYHSINGAVEEALHVYIRAGLLAILPLHTSLHILEMGFGTGLNLLLTEAFSPDDTSVFYTAIEAYPLQEQEIQKLNYDKIISDIHVENIMKIHHLPWDETFYPLRHNFALKKVIVLFENYELEKDLFDLVYFDAFAPDVQNELWTDEIFASLYVSMKNGGVLCTYSAKGILRRRLQACGFKVERLQGACGKREMLRAVKVE